MHSHESLQIQPAIVLPGDSGPIIQLKQKLNEVIRKLDEAYRLLHMDVRIMDFRELPPHYKISHSAWKFYQDKDNGDLQLWHRSGNIWSKTFWTIRGDLTRPT